MKTIAIIGCSYAGLLSSSLRFKNPLPDVNFIVNYSVGSGNQCISAATLDILATKKLDAIVVLWSGINRIDIPVGMPLHLTNNPEKNSLFFRIVGNQVWYHSGGFGCSGFYEPTPPVVRDYFKYQHLGETATYFTDLTLHEIVKVQCLIKELNIPSYMSFIYDIHADYTTQPDKLFDKPLEHTLGKINLESRLSNLIDWHSLALTNTPYEWAKARNLLQFDEFHPETAAIYEWFNQFVAPTLGLT